MLAPDTAKVLATSGMPVAVNVVGDPSPAPDTVSVWVAEVGPSDAANATKISPAADVLNDGVACVPAAVGGDDLVDGEGLG